MSAPRAKRRRPCRQCRTTVAGTYVERPLCQMCRRERLGLDVVPAPGEGRSAYWRAYHRHRLKTDPHYRTPQERAA